MYDNTTTVVGNLTRNPELVETVNMPLANFGVAVNRRWTDRDTGKQREDTSFFECVAFNEMATNIVDSLKRGDRVIVHGALRQRSWEGDDGSKRSAVEINVEDIGPALKWATAEVTKNARD